VPSALPPSCPQHVHRYQGARTYALLLPLALPLRYWLCPTLPPQRNNPGAAHVSVIFTRCHCQKSDITPMSSVKIYADN